MPHSLENLTPDEVLAVASLFPALAPHTGDEKALIQAAAEVIGKAVGDTCVIRILDDLTGRLGASGVWSRDADLASAIRSALDANTTLFGGPLGPEVVLSNQVVMANVDKDALLPQLPPSFGPLLERLDLVSLAIVPLAAPGAPLGFIAVTRESTSPPLTPRDVELLNGFVPRLSVLLANARLVSRVHRELEQKEVALFELAESEARFRTILEHTFDMIGVFALDGVLSYVSPSVERILGYTSEEMLGRDVVEFVHPEDIDTLLSTAERVAIGGESMQLEYRIRAADGRWVHIEAAAAGTTTIDGKLGIVVSARDVTERLRAEQERRLLAEIVQSSEDAIVSVDASGVVTSWNPAAERMYERRAEEVIGRPVERSFEGENLARLFGVRARLDRRGPVRQNSTFRRPSDGGRVELSVIAWPLYDSDGKDAGRASISRDVSDRAEGERRLVESEHFFRALFEGAPVGVAVLDSDGVVARFNPALVALVGRDVEALAGLRYIDLIEDDDRAAVQATIKTAGAGREPVSVEHRIRRRSGPVIVAATTISAVGSHGQLIVHVHDVSAAKVAERFHLQRAKQQACVAQLGAVALTETDLDRLAETAAELTAETLGVAQVHIRSLEEPPIFQAVAASAGGPLPPRSETVRVPIRAPGRAIGVLEVTRPAGSEDVRLFLVAVGSMLGAAAERRSLEAQVIMAERVKDIGALAGSVAHDFNNLLTIVLSAGEMARKRVESDPEAVEELGKVIDAGTRAAGLVRQLTAWSKEQALAPVSVNLSGLLVEMEPVLRSLAGDRLDFSLQSSNSKLFVEVERTNLEQILVNLVVNAREALPGGGRLSIALDGEHRGGRDGVRLTVTDDGPGMGPEVAAQCFTPFFTTKRNGTGLGLPTVHRIVTLAGGEVNVHTAPGEGTTFRIWLPLQAGGRHATAPRRAPSPHAGSEMVLVVEDETHVRELLTRSLAAAGYSVIVADDGDRAVELAGRLEESIDILVTDVVMPGRSGIAVANELRHRWPDLPVLYITGHAPQGGGSPEGADAAVLRKPFTPSEFVSAVRQELDAARA